MDKINNGYHLMVQKTFRITNFGNLPITLEGMAFGNDNVNPNHTLFMKQSACIYDYNMFNTFNNSENEIKTDKK